MATKPFISIIIVNYNGKHFLHECLTSVFNQSYPSSKFEVLLVDNNSHDMSVSYVKQHFPVVRTIESKTNLGFAAGNNLGVSKAKGKYVVLLNNDTKVDRKWLEKLVAAIDKKPEYASINSKTLLYYPFVKLRIASDIFTWADFSDTGNLNPVGVLVEKVLLENSPLQRLVHYQSGFYEKEKGIIESRWTRGDATVLVPLDPRAKEQKISLTLRSEKSVSKIATNVRLFVGEELMLQDSLASHEVMQYDLVLPVSKLKKHFVYQVQNAGNIVFKQGGARDRGASVKGTYQTYELDSQFFNKPSEVPAACGVSVIFNKRIYQEAGGFDERFFMYYEDIDLSLRLRRRGYKCGFEPSSFLYHIHAGSSGENSAFFQYWVERNYLIVLLKHFPLRIVLWEVVQYLGALFVALLKTVKWRTREHWELFDHWKEKASIRFAVLRSVLLELPKFLGSRFLLQKNQNVSLKELHNTFY